MEAENDYFVWYRVKESLSRSRTGKKRVLGRGNEGGQHPANPVFQATPTLPHYQVSGWEK